MWDVADTTVETISYDEVSKQLAAVSRELKLIKAEREHNTHRDWAYQPNLPSKRVYLGPEEVNIWPSYQPEWNQTPTYTWNQDQGQDFEPCWYDNQGDMWDQDQGQSHHPYWQEDSSYVCNQSHEQEFQPDRYGDPYFQDQWRGPDSAPQFEYPPPPQGPTLEESLKAAILAAQKSKVDNEAMCERIDAHYENIMGCLSELRKQSLAKESPEQLTDDNDDEELIEPETSDVVADLGELIIEYQRPYPQQPPPPEQPYPQQPPPPQDPYPQRPLPPQSIEHKSSVEAVKQVETIVVESANGSCYQDLTDEKVKGDEYMPVFGFPELTADFFSFQLFYFIPSASYFKNCSSITIADSWSNYCFWQDVGKDCLLLGPADVREEDERIQAIEWLRLEMEFG